MSLLFFKNYDFLIAASLLSAVILLLLRPLAIKHSFVDIPNQRKTHQDHIPIIGGTSIFLAIVLVTLVFYQNFSRDQISWLVCSGFMLVLGVIDDKVDLPASTKLIAQIAITSIFIAATDYTVTNLGSPFGFSGPVELGLLSFTFTLFAIVGLTNAINMMDGCDGLASSLVIVSFLGLLIFGFEGLSNTSRNLLLVVSFSLFVFLFFNFSNSKRLKTFLGDGGSLFLGFTLSASLVEFQNSSTRYDPTIALWLAAVPIFDICAVVVRRKLLKRKILAADRSHIHHLFLAWGFSHFLTTVLISLAALVLLLFGVFVTTNHPSISFWSFLALFIIYLSMRLVLGRAK